MSNVRRSYPQLAVHQQAARLTGSDVRSTRHNRKHVRSAAAGCGGGARPRRRGPGRRDARRDASGVGRHRPPIAAAAQLFHRRLSEQDIGTERHGASTVGSRWPPRWPPLRGLVAGGGWPVAVGSASSGRALTEVGCLVRRRRCGLSGDLCGGVPSRADDRRRRGGAAGPLAGAQRSHVGADGHTTKSSRSSTSGCRSWNRPRCGWRGRPRRVATSASRRWIPGWPRFGVTFGHLTRWLSTDGSTSWLPRFVRLTHAPRPSAAPTRCLRWRRALPRCRAPAVRRIVRQRNRMPPSGMS